MQTASRPFITGRVSLQPVDDVFLHHSFTTLIWLMVANSTKKFKMKLYIYEWLLGVVYMLCKINIKDKVSMNLIEVIKFHVLSSS
jgi:hypothetical protein